MDLILHKKLMALQLENNELRKQLEQLQEEGMTRTDRAKKATDKVRKAIGMDGEAGEPKGGGK